MNNFLANSSERNVYKSQRISRELTVFVAMTRLR
jgi:hypothetical protein